MTSLHNLKPPAGAKKARTRVGRGNASKGNFSGRGIKGQKAHSKVPVTFEGGQLPLVKRLPEMRGFFNRFRVEYVPVNLADLTRFEGKDEVTPVDFYQARITRKQKSLVKVLGNGDLKSALVVKAHKFSETARKKIEKAGGKCVEIAFEKDPPSGSKKNSS